MTSNTNDDNIKSEWFMEHKGPRFSPAYKLLPRHVKLKYRQNGIFQNINLSKDAEEIAGFYARTLDEHNTTLKLFNKNFLQDWREVMEEEEKNTIKDLKDCDFSYIQSYFQNIRKKEKPDKETEKVYGFCVHGHKVRIRNAMLDPPGLIITKEEHPEMGKLRKRVTPEDITINCSDNSKIPAPPTGYQWKLVQHDPTVNWLASWTDTVENKTKYIEVYSNVEIVETSLKNCQEDEKEVWKYFKRQKKYNESEWFFEHNGPVFSPPYEPLPKTVKLIYDGAEVNLSTYAEEVAGYYSKVLDRHEAQNETFNTNFFNAWRKAMTVLEADLIKDFKKCDFSVMYNYFKNSSAGQIEEESIQNEYCIIGYKEKIANFNVEPPDLYKPQGNNHNMGKVRKRVLPNQITINCSKNSKIPQPPAGYKWEEVIHRDKFQWLASWTENIQGLKKYIKLDPYSLTCAKKEFIKYVTVRKVHSCIKNIRKTYRSDWKSEDVETCQTAVALYFIDRLALRVGNESQAGTIGCCSLRFEHVKLHPNKDDKKFVVIFDFFGKTSVRYYNEVPVEEVVYNNMKTFLEEKKDGEIVFDQVSTDKINRYLKNATKAAGLEINTGSDITAKVLRTYRACITLHEQLENNTKAGSTIKEKVLVFGKAHEAVALLCNHKRQVKKGKKSIIDEISANELDDKEILERKLNNRIAMALDSSIKSYLDPRITVAWCKKHHVPVETIVTESLFKQFRWARETTSKEFCWAQELAPGEQMPSSSLSA